MKSHSPFCSVYSPDCSWPMILAIISASEVGPFTSTLSPFSPKPDKTNINSWKVDIMIYICLPTVNNPPLTPYPFPTLHQTQPPVSHDPWFSFFPFYDVLNTSKFPDLVKINLWTNILYNYEGKEWKCEYSAF